jgi:hypothetical protein
MKITAQGHKSLNELEATIHECAGQENRIKAFALLGAYSTAVINGVWVKANRPQHTELIARLEDLARLAESVPKNTAFEHNVSAWTDTLKETSPLMDRVSGFAYKYAFDRLEQRVSWARISQPENSELLKQAQEPLRGYNKDRALNVSQGFNP